MKKITFSILSLIIAGSFITTGFAGGHKYKACKKICADEYKKCQAEAAKAGGKNQKMKMAECKKQKRECKKKCKSKKGY